MSKSMEAALNMIEHAVYGIDLDTAIRVAVKNRKDCNTFLATSPMSEIVTDVEEKLIAESSAKKAAQVAQEGEDDNLLESRQVASPQHVVDGLPWRNAA